MRIPQRNAQTGLELINDPPALWQFVFVPVALQRRIMAAAFFISVKINPSPSAKIQVNFAGVAAPPMGQDLVRASRIFGDYGMFSGQSGQMIRDPSRSFLKHRVTLRFLRPVA